MDEEKLGARFWLWLAGILAIGAIAFVVVIIFLNGAYRRWGAFGAIAFFVVIMIIAAWFYDRRQQHKYDDLDEA
jgi:L-asparagine transporter-like permease